MKKISLITLNIFSLLLTFSSWAQTQIKGTALIEGVTSVATAAGTTTLTLASQTNNVFTGTTTQIIVLPAGTTLSKGRYFRIINQSTGMLTVNMSGGTFLKYVVPNETYTAFITDNSTTAGVWTLGPKGSVFLGSLSWAITTNCQWNTTSTSYANYANDTDCDDNARTAVGVVTDGAAGLRPAVSFPYVGPGYYEVIVAGQLDNSTAAIRAFCRGYDGTNQWDGEGATFNGTGSGSGIGIPSYRFGKVLSSGTTITVDFQCKNASGAGSIPVDARGIGLAFAVKFTPLGY